MADPIHDPIWIDSTDLLNRYAFDMGAFSADQLVGYWARSYPLLWIRSAIVEALYQGRYKSVSVGQILSLWQRRGQPLHHYNFEFERIVCNSFGVLPMDGEAASTQTTAQPTAQAPPQSAAQSTSEEATERSPQSATTAPPGSSPRSAIAPLSPQTPIDVPAQVVGADALDWVSHHRLSSRPAPQPLGVELADLMNPDEWWAGDAGKHPIHNFVPESEGSVFYEKLRSVAYGEGETVAQDVADAGRTDVAIATEPAPENPQPAE